MKHHQYTPKKDSPKRELLDEQSLLQVMDIARKLLLETGRVHTVVLVQATNQAEILACPILLPDESTEKLSVLRDFGHHIQEEHGQIEQAAMMCESWFVDAKNAPDALSVSPSEHPSRQEALMLIGRDTSGEHRALLLQPFERDSADAVSLGEMQILISNSNTQQTNFTFTGILDALFEE